MSAFRVGQKVVCVDASNGYANHEPVPLLEGSIYEVASFEAGHMAVIGVYLRWFAPSRFRPAVDQFDFNKLVTPAELEKFKLDERAPKSNPLKVSP